MALTLRKNDHKVNIGNALGDGKRRAEDDEDGRTFAQQEVEGGQTVAVIQGDEGKRLRALFEDDDLFQNAKDMWDNLKPERQRQFVRGAKKDPEDTIMRIAADIRKRSKDTSKEEARAMAKRMVQRLRGEDQTAVVPRPAQPITEIIAKESTNPEETRLAVIEGIKDAAQQEENEKALTQIARGREDEVDPDRPDLRENKLLKQSGEEDIEVDPAEGTLDPTGDLNMEKTGEALPGSDEGTDDVEMGEEDPTEDPTEGLGDPTGLGDPAGGLGGAPAGGGGTATATSGSSAGGSASGGSVTNTPSFAPVITINMPSATPSVTAPEVPPAPDVTAPVTTAPSALPPVPPVTPADPVPPAQPAAPVPTPNCNKHRCYPNVLCSSC
jgi:hypothetical protein